MVRFVLCVCVVCVLYIFRQPGPNVGIWIMAVVLEDDLSTGRLSMCVYRPAVAFFFAFFFFFYGGTLQYIVTYMGLSQPRAAACIYTFYGQPTLHHRIARKGVGLDLLSRYLTIG